MTHAVVVALGQSRTQSGRRPCAAHPSLESSGGRAACGHLLHGPVVGVVRGGQGLALSGGVAGEDVKTSPFLVRCVVYRDVDLVSAHDVQLLPC
ncbi:hypothetical protein [Streptantibioticus ferralitis]|uniref:Uncharacterized protein n=1 Tax=Streptantibioticus ferralitis TaxID=236510 RepID=A0ABT5Z7A9_9ACTN|nr:hypothetical protein [Streptantibioticus ferralitis]MDF2259721.1 hypothetical protein [Streptantibioticus ferralitis]